MATSFSWLPPLGISHILDQAEEMFSVRKKSFALVTASKCWDPTMYFLQGYSLHSTQPCREWFSSLGLVPGKGCQKLHGFNDTPERSEGTAFEGQESEVLETTAVFSPLFDGHTRTLGLGTEAQSAWSDFRAEPLKR